MEADGARKVKEQAELPAAIEELLTNVEASAAMGQRARNVVTRNQGATAAIVELVDSTLGRES